MDTMLQFSDSVADEIRFRLRSVDEASLDNVLEELHQFAGYGVEGGILLLNTCLACLIHHRSDLNLHSEDVLVSVLKHMLTKPNFCATFGLSLSREMITEDFLDYLSKALHLNVNEKITIGLALSDSQIPETRNCGKNFIMAQVEEVLANFSSRSVEKIQSILLFLHKSEGLCKHIDSFVQILSLVQLKDDTSYILAPFLSDEMRETQTFRNLDCKVGREDSDFNSILAEMQKEIIMGYVMKDLGHGCTVNESQCKEILSLFSPLTDVTVSRLLGTIVQSHVSHGDSDTPASDFCMALVGSSWPDLPSPSSWNIDILVDSIKQIAPDINWISVFECLDHEGFNLPNEDAFLFLISIYGRACQDPFPLSAICGSIWKNTEGQLSFLKYAVSAPPEVFTFAHSTRQLAYVDAVHDHKLQIGHANHAWLCLDLLNVLCQLAERGHTSPVRIMLEYPLKFCPEILLLGMAHINTACNLLRSEVSSIVFPLVMKSAAGIGMILYLWRVNPLLVLRGFVDTVALQPDITSSILDISVELKILPQVLEMIPWSVGIRVAALASRKEIIDLENWLNTSLSVYKFSFFEECLEFLKQIEIGYSSAKGSDHYEGLLSLYLESASTFYKVLMSQVGVIGSPQQIEELERLRVTLMQSNTRLQNGGATEFSTSEEFTEDIDQEANTYFQQMFSGQLTVEAMVQMLSRFKESSVKREQSIYDCIIGNLFEEYKFFPKYPERQLKIAAVLFGSVIKDQLVAHIMLGIALRCVLDALRKPADSKMFVFGTKALEQFVDRLIEWPQYCNHILQISHLRATHPEIVAFIERTLTRISSSHLESEPFTGLGVQPSATQTSIGNTEPFEVSGANSGMALQLPPLQLQPRQEISIDERHKAFVPSSIDPKPMTGKTPLVSVSEASNIQKNSVSSVAPIISSQGFARPSRVATSARFGSALNIETLIAAAEKRDLSIEAPASEVQDKISFLINNISSANVEAKAKEFTEILKEHYYPWFAQYMVMKRASIEPNFHDVYLKFLDKVDSKALNREVLQASYENCKVLLGSDLIKSSSEERSLLKNLGSWLGKLTIGRNQVLRAREIDPKSLIIEAYEKGKMIAVIPFTSKILEPCQSSLAYRPPNPWTMGILGLLAEIYKMPNLKMNLKFDIEVLFKNLGMDMKDQTPGSLLKDRPREVEGNPDFSNKDAGAPQTQMIADVKAGVLQPNNQVEMPHKSVTPSDSGGPVHLMSQYAAPLHLSSGMLMEDDKLAALSLSDQPPSAQGLIQSTQSQSSFSVSQLPSPILNIGTHVVINQKLSTLGLHIHFQRVVPHAMERAIKEIVAAIVQRSVTIATQTTKELVLKDYAVESDETRVYNAAHLMVASLAGSLAHVTCKEPLRASISSQLRTTIQGLNISSELLEQAVQLVTNDNLDLGCAVIEQAATDKLVTNDNLDLGCAVIEQAATDKAIQTIDGEITQQLCLRRKHREGVTPAFFDASAFSQGSIGVLPEALRPKPGHLSLSQQRVYEDFVRLPWQNHSSQSSLSSGPASSGSVSSSAYEVASGQLPGYASISANTCIDPVSRQQDVSSDGLESTPAPYFSGSSTHTGAIDGIINQHVTSEKISVTCSLPLSASTSELSSMGMDNTNTVKEANPQPLPSSAATERLGSSAPDPLLQPRDALDKYQIVAQKLEDLAATDARDAEVQRLISEVPEIILRCRSRDEAALAVAQKVFKGLYENASNNFHIMTHLAILAAIRDVCKLVVKELTSWVIYSDEERKFNKDITIGLFGSELLNLAEYNVHMAKLIDGGRNKAATEFSISLLQTLVTEEYSVVSELHSIVEALSKLSTKPGSPESLQQLIETLRNPGVNVPGLSISTIGKEDKVKQLKDKKAPGSITPGRDDYGSIDFVEPDPAGFQEQVCSMFTEWYRICELPTANEVGQSHFILKLHQNGFLKADEMTDRLIRGLMEVAVGHCLSSENINSGAVQSAQPAQNLSFLAIDPYSKLLFSILKYGSEQASTKLLLLQRILGATVKYILKDADDKKVSFNPRPYFRLFINWLLDLNSLDPALDSTNFPILMAFANAFHLLQPLKVPGFSFAWLELVSHRSFMPKILTGNSQKGWPLFQKLLVGLLQFMEPYLRNAELGVSIHFLYKGTLRVLLVLLHDFPEFLSDYHFTFCDAIPSTCIQMRNIILSAFPRNMRLPDPSTPNLKIDLLAEISLSPRILSDVDAALKARHIKADVDEYLKAPRQQAPSSFLTELKPRLLLPASEAATAGTRYDVPLINSLVLYIGMQAIQQLQPSRTGQPMNSQVSLTGFLVSAALEILQTLILDLDSEGRYLFLNAVANQLRYPNTHTHYYSFVLLYLFAESNQDIIQEQITRVLFERLIVNRPHPWGLLITFIELIKNPRYNFWNRSFIRCAPEIEKLFESVARSCGGPKPVDDSVSAWISDNTH